ncbi:MAG: DinB family protein [Gemmatimonadales bacterium]
MTDDQLKPTLLRQLDIAWSFARYHLDGLTTEACLWRPGARGLHVHHRGDGTWTADWPDRESYDIGPPSAAWTTWHIGFWWSMTLDHSFGTGTLTREQVLWPGTADGVRKWLGGLHDEWQRQAEALDSAAWGRTELVRWPFTERSFADLAAWVNLELMKNAAEIGATLFQRGAGKG